MVVICEEAVTKNTANRDVEDGAETKDAEQSQEPLLVFAVISVRISPPDRPGLLRYCVTYPPWISNL